MPFDANTLRSLGLDPQAAATLGALSGLRGLDEAGFRRTAGPMGSIAQNLMPLVQAVQQAKVAQQQAEMQNQLLGLEELKTRAQIARLLMPGAQGRPLGIEQEIVQRLNAGRPIQDLISAKQAMQKPSMPGTTALTAQALQEQTGQQPTATDILGALQNQKRQQAEYVSSLMVNRAQALSDVREAEKQAAEDRVMPDKTGAAYVVDSLTGRRVPGATMGEIKASQGRLLTMKPTDFQVLSKAKQAIQQLDQLETLIPKVLPTKAEGYLGRAISLTGLKTRKRLGTDTDVTQFDLLSKFSKMPAIMTLNSLRRLPMAEVSALPDLSRDSDTQESALARIKVVRSWMAKALDDMGVSPDALSTPTSGLKDLGNGLKYEQIK